MAVRAALAMTTSRPADMSPPRGLGLLPIIRPSAILPKKALFG